MSYSGLTTKIRAMQSHLLNLQNFREIVELSSVPQALAYLREKPSYSELLAAWTETTSTEARSSGR